MSRLDAARRLGADLRECPRCGVAFSLTVPVRYALACPTHAPVDYACSSACAEAEAAIRGGGTVYTFDSGNGVTVRIPSTRLVPPL